MSTILKALRRLEEEKAARHARGLRDEVLSPPREPGSGSGRPGDRGTRQRASLIVPVLLGASAALALAAALAFAFWPTFVESTPSGVDSTAPAPDASAALPREPAPRVALAPTTPEVAAPPPRGVAEVAAPTDPPPLGSDEPPLPTSASPPTVAAPAPVTPPRPRAAARRLAEPAASDAELEGLPGRTVDVRRPDEAWLDEPPPRAEERVAVVERSGGPDVVVSRLVWHPSAERRSAFVDPAGGGARREVREGDYVEDYVVRRIEPSVVVFAREGVEVRRRIGQGP